MTLSLLLCLLAGSICGVIVGALPGVGMLSLMIIAYPLLMKLNSIDVIFFYAAALSMTQFIGSVIAINLGIPGNTGSFPAVEEGHKLKRLNLQTAGVSFTALGSLIGGLISLVMFYVFFKLLNFDFSVLFKTNVYVAFLCFVIITISLFCKNSKSMNFFLMFVGWMIGYIGWHVPTEVDILTFGFAQLTSGVPFIAACIGILILPDILHELQNANNVRAFSKTKYRIKTFFKYYLGPTSRGSVVGFFTGFIPGLAVELSSFAAYLSEKKFRKRKNVNQSNMSALVAAETSNNAGIFSAMLPVILLGIPITGSEAILVNIIHGQGLFFTEETAITILAFVPVVFIFINVIGYVCASPLSNTMMIIYKLRKEYLQIILSVLCILSVVMISQYQIFFDLCVLGVFFVLGLWLKRNKIDTLPIVIGLLMQNTFDSALFRFFILNF